MAQTKHFLQRFECIDLEQDQIVGFGEVFNLPGMFHPGKFMVNILVDPERQGTGIGRAIYNRLNEELVNLNAILVWAMSKEDLPRRIEFFRRRGFVEKSRSWESRLDLTIADTAKFGGYVEKALKEGIIFTTLAEERLRGQDSLRKIHELVQLITADMPREAAFTPLTFEQWETFSLKKPAADP